MNIFVLDTDPSVAAQYHCDLHVSKMIMESIHMMKVYVNSVIDKPYFMTKKGKPVKGYRNHPCTTWIFESKAHFRWLCDLVIALNDEWQIRYNHNHDHGSLAEFSKIQELAYAADDWDTDEFLGWATALPDSIYPHDRIVSDSDIVTLYRKYYIEHKTHFASWAFLDIPDWWIYNQFVAGMAFCRLNKAYFEEIDQVDLYRLINESDNADTYELAESFKKKRKKKEPKPPTLAEKVRNHIKKSLKKKIPRVTTIEKWIASHGKHYDTLIGIANQYIEDNQ